ncbi:lipoyl(octanoyl) transferase LipB [Halochromatium salexigens]|uniref:lipoyl(octanoyl) transferase LipB n=1 Tax=Halochromatium salexigens TaxID=49447 RepID=UPI0030B84EE1
MPSEPLPLPLRVRWLGQCDYAATWERMRSFTDAREAGTEDELWLLEHPPVFTLGQAGLPEHVLDPGPIPVIQCDRGGQVTYHGPGQLVAYLLLDLKRSRLGVKQLVHLLEQAIIEFLAEQAIVAQPRADAPGVYVGAAKIASVGLRVRHGCSYHGIALNIDLDPAPFARINPCGYPGLAVTRLCDHGSGIGVQAAGEQFAAHLCRLLGRPLGRDSEVAEGTAI